ncbi:MAG: hypothetical protein ACOX1G_05825 [bacterium]|jgi:hypothetical protein
MKRFITLFKTICLLGLLAIEGMISLLLITPVDAGVKVEFYRRAGSFLAETPRTQFTRGEGIQLQILTDTKNTGIVDGTVSLAAKTEGQSVIVWQAENNRRVHSVYLSTANLRSGQYSLTAIIQREKERSVSSPLKFGINPSIADDFPIFTFGITKRNPYSLDESKSLIQRYRQGGYNQFYYFQGIDLTLRMAPGITGFSELCDFMDYCRQNRVGLVAMLNTFLYGLRDDDSSALAASGNFPHTYVSHKSIKRMTSVRHPRFIDEAQNRLRMLMTFYRQWPVIRGINLDDEPSATFYNVYGAGRMDKAPEGSKWWGNGDYNPYNVSLFKKKYSIDPPRYSLASEVHAKYPAGSVISHRDPWLLWMEFTGGSMGDYYAKIVPLIKNMAPVLPVFNQPFLGHASSFQGGEKQSMFKNLDVVNFHWIATGHPIESAASSVILAHSIKGNKPIRAMIHSANFFSQRSDPPEKQVYNPAYVMQQFWSAIGLGAKGIGDQGESDMSRRKDTWERWTKGCQDVTAIAPLLLNAKRPKSPVALLYSVESEWMQSVYLNHPLECWRQHHTFELIEAALQRANIPFDIVSTLDLVNNPRMLSSYQAVVCAAIDYARDDVYSAMRKSGARFFITPESALKLPGAYIMKDNFNELYRLFLETGIRDRRSYDHIINEKAMYFRQLFKHVNRSADTTSRQMIVFALDAPGSKLVFPVNCSLNWMQNSDPTAEVMAKIHKITGPDFNMPSGSVEAKEIVADVYVQGGRFAYDLRTHKELPVTMNGKRLSFSQSLPGGEGTVIAVTPTKIADIKVESGPTPGKFRVKAMDNNNKFLNWALPVRIDIIDPEGRVSHEYSSFQLIENGMYEGCLDWAINDLPGKWCITITELASNRKADILLQNKDTRNAAEK